MLTGKLKKCNDVTSPLIGTCVPFQSVRFGAKIGSARFNKSAIAVTCLVVIGGGGTLVLAREWQRKQEKQQVELVRSTNLSALYRQINLDSFDGQLSGDVPVSWDELGGNGSGGDYVGMTDFDDGKSAIRIDVEKVRSEEHLLGVPRHEMCHVATHDVVRQTGQDPHGVSLQVCMKRFE